MASRLICLLMCVGLSAQTAKVVQLSGADAAKVRATHEALDKAQKAWDAVQQQIRDEYVSSFVWVPDEGPGGITVRGATAGSVLYYSENGGFMASHPACDAECLKRAEAERARVAKLPKKKEYTVKYEWRGGFEFSEDFRFIVPKPPTTLYAPSPRDWPMQPIWSTK
jgi:hypothetical protein